MNHQKSLLVSMGFALVLLTFSESANANKALNHDNLNAIPVGQTSSTTVTTTSSGIHVRRGVGLDFQGETLGGVNIFIPQDVVKGISSDRIVICLTDVCRPTSNTDSSTISVNDLAHLVEQDLNQAWNDLVVAEQAASDGTIASDDSRKIVRRDSSNNENCGCVPGERKIARELSLSDTSASSQQVETVTKARDRFRTKLGDSRIFIEQVNQLKPENSLW